MFAVIRTRKRVHTFSRLPVRPCRFTALGALATAVVLLGAIGHPVTARADLLDVELVPANTNVTVPPGYVGTLELDLLNPATNTQSFNVAGFQFELQVSAGSGVLFTNATTSTTKESYIFANNSFSDTYLFGSLITSTSPTNDLTALDTVASPGTYTTLNPGDSYGLGLISFTVIANAPSGTVPISIIPFDFNTALNGTQISDNTGAPIAFNASNGTIQIQGVITIPEPSSLTIVAVAGVFSLLGYGCRRQRMS